MEIIKLFPAMTSQETISLEDDAVIKLCETDFMYTSKYKWTIDNYSSLKKDMDDVIESPPFTVGPKEETTWLCKLTPGGGYRDRRTFISFWMQGCAYPGATAYAKIKFIGISNAQGTVLLQGYAFRLEKACMTTYRGLVYEKNISMNENFKQRSITLPGDKLCVSWEISVFSHMFINEMSMLVKHQQITLSSDLKNLLNSSNLADVELIASDTQEIHAHKAILAARSPVFCAMFTDDTKEKRENRLLIKDMESSVLKRMINFMYTGDIGNLDSKTALKLLVAAEKYDLKELKSLCEIEILISGPTVEDAADYLRMAFMHNTSEKVKISIVKYIKENLNDVKKTEKWKDLTTCDPNLLCQMLEYALSLR